LKEKAIIKVKYEEGRGVKRQEARHGGKKESLETARERPLAVQD